jgi:hypothetical protein
MNAPSHSAALLKEDTDADILPEQDALYECARAVHFLYGLLFNRNPDAEWFEKYMSAGSTVV